jgi:hydrogenase maturation protein HypF
MNEVRLRIELDGVVQGVGMRPHVARLALKYGLTGFVRNSARGVELEVQGHSACLDQFRRQLTAADSRQRGTSTRVTCQDIPITLSPEPFRILESQPQGEVRPSLAPDLAICRDCLSELSDPANRRYRYPFISCAGCGPRYSIANGIPFDRERTSMRAYPLCPACEREYRDPADRRFHAQTIACPECGPQVTLLDSAGRVLVRRDEGIREAVAAIRQGAILAVKGIGGFHLMVNAAQAESVERLRFRKVREAKPLAVMFPSTEAIERECEVSAVERQLIESAEAPIVLLQKRIRDSEWIAPNVAPGNSLLGCFLPYAPLHLLLLAEIGKPVVATSGNRSEEVLCVDNEEALRRLQGIADYFLMHDREIVHHVDDSVVRVILDRELVLRAGRGYTPCRVRIPEVTSPVVAVGAHQKCAIAFGVESLAYVQPHIGDLSTAETIAAFQRDACGLPRAMGLDGASVACDCHPDYASTRFAEESGQRVTHVQHHHAHVLACCLENEIEGPVLGVAWDGSGWGDDGTIWGGEFLRVDENGYERIAHLRTFPLPGGAQAVREPRRSAVGLMFAAYGERFEEHLPSPLTNSFTRTELTALRSMLKQQFQSPATSSVGRLFDAVSALMGLRLKDSFEGQAAMDLEFASNGGEAASGYSMLLNSAGVIDWQPLLEELLADIAVGSPAGQMAAKFHQALADCVVHVAQYVGLQRVILTGGCFQNGLLLTKCVTGLRNAGFEPSWHCRVPPNDGGIAIGQLAAAAYAMRKRY